MDNLNNLYNFKNPIRHFFNIDNIILPNNLDDIDLNGISWTSPIKFRIRKDEKSYRVLKFPNILNFLCALREFKEMDNFYDIQDIDERKRVNPNIQTGDFKSNNFSEKLENDFNSLCIFDYLIRLDIKSFYGRLYLHNLDLKELERYIGNMNNGNSNEVILGNYISLFIAERFLKIISDDLYKKFQTENIECEFSYFSDDFYFFCNKEDNNKVIKIFDEVLEKYELERNNDKYSVWSYEEYSDYNLVEKYWKKIVSEDRLRCRNADGTEKKGKRNFYFINQLIYRKSNLKDTKLQKVFINNFFKSTYYHNLSLENYELQDFNCHQLFSMFKFSPEILLYTLPKFKKFDLFIKKIEKFLSVRYHNSLETNFFEEQLYYFYAIKSLGLDDILIKNKDSVLNKNNQILKSYYLIYNFFDSNDIDILKNNIDEDQWFVNYHLILSLNDVKNLEDNIRTYLIPKLAVGKPSKEDNYLKFYKENLDSKKTLIKKVDSLELGIQEYINLKISERSNIEETKEDDTELYDPFEYDYF